MQRTWEFLVWEFFILPSFHSSLFSFSDKPWWSGTGWNKYSWRQRGSPNTCNINILLSVVHCPSCYRHAANLISDGLPWKEEEKWPQTGSLFIPVVLGYPPTARCIPEFFWWMLGSLDLCSAENGLWKTAAGRTAGHCQGDNKRMFDKHLRADFSPAEADWQHTSPDLLSTCGSTELRAKIPD